MLDKESIESLEIYAHMYVHVLLIEVSVVKIQNYFILIFNVKWVLCVYFVNYLI